MMQQFPDEVRKLFTDAARGDAAAVERLWQCWENLQIELAAQDRVLMPLTMDTGDDMRFRGRSTALALLSLTDMVLSAIIRRTYDVAEDDALELMRECRKMAAQEVHVRGGLAAMRRSLNNETVQ